MKNITKLEVKLYHNQMSEKLRRMKKMQNSTSKEYRDLIALRDARRKILELLQQNLDELLKSELNNEEPPWRTLVTKG